VGSGGRGAVAHGHRPGAGDPGGAGEGGHDSAELDLFEINEAFAGQCWR
jgi:hypothetical protein